jgi:hypothetical protein
MSHRGTTIYESLARHMAQMLWNNEAWRPSLDTLDKSAFDALAFAAIEEYERVGKLCDWFQRLRGDPIAAEPVKHFIEAFDALGVEARFSDADMAKIERAAFSTQVPF